MHLRKHKWESGTIVHMPRGRVYTRLYWAGAAMDVCWFMLLLALLFVVQSAHSQRRDGGYVTYQQFRDLDTEQNERLRQVEEHIENDDKIINGWEGQLTLIKWMVGGGTLPMAAASVVLRLAEKRRNG